MGNNITQPFNIFPIYLKMSWKKRSFRYLVQSFQTLTYRNKLHTNRVENCYSCRRYEKIIATMIRLRTFLYMPY